MFEAHMDAYQISKGPGSIESLLLMSKMGDQLPVIDFLIGQKHTQKGYFRLTFSIR